ncbi:expressed protein [Phakopsora pachyrhizi]|uniref:ATP-dependent DNA helicase n=1 Tax=Phakopsora pachyrhizi TaxID=170000 RepID=A0AAV0B5W4_PHAPC|nr:expressed protein [Phakopsora pachyrhizi]
MFKSKDSTLSNPTSDGKLNQINNENLAKCSGTVSSIQRRWTTAEPSQQVPSSSLPSWQADESDWPPSPPRKTTTSISTTPISKSQQGDAKPLHSYLYNSNKSSSITNNSSKTNISNNQSNLIKKHPLTLKRQFPWDTPDKGTRSSIFGQSHLSNPRMSIAAKVNYHFSAKHSAENRHIISALRRQYDSKTDAVAVTASTGMAACAIGGTTIHCFAGIGLGNESQEKLLSRVRRNRKASGKWMRASIQKFRQLYTQQGTSRLDAIKEEAVIFEAHDSGKSTPEQRKRDLDNMMAVSRLVLKKGQVEDFVDNHTTLEAYHSREINKTLKDDFFSSDEDNDEKSFQSRSYNGQPPLRGEAKKNLEKSNSNGGSNPKNRFLLPVVRWHLPNGKKEVTIVEKAEFKVENQEGEIQSQSRTNFE